LGAANWFSKAAGKLQQAFLKPPGEFTFIEDFRVALEKPVGIAAGVLEKPAAALQRL
jgi:hypothetical protein